MNAMATSQAPLMDTVGQGTLLGHPKGLFVLFFTELWERFNFYGMRALLVIYFIREFAFEEKLAYASYGAYNGLVYATPLIGGMLADRLLGYRRAILMGGVLMALGEFGLAFIGFGLLPKTLMTMYLTLSFIIVGNGLFKPNISTMVGSLYKQGDPRREGAFTIFYMGINIGACSPLLCSPIGFAYGFHWGFGLAGVGMVLGLCSFLLFQRYLGDVGYPPQRPSGSHGPSRRATANTLVWLGVLAFVPLGAYLVAHPHFVKDFAAPSVGALFLIYIAWEAMRSTKAERQGIYVVLLLTFFSVVFWAFFEQAGSSMNVFTERHVNRVVLGWEITPATFQAVNAIFIVLLAPLFSWLWLRLGRVGKDPSSPLKFALALIQLGVGFGMLVIGAKYVSAGGKSPLIWLVLAYLFHTMGELCLSPVGLSMITKMAPVRLAGLLMGVWFLSSAFAHIAGGALAGFSVDWGFEKLYTAVMLFAFGSGVLLFVIYPVVKRWEKARLASHHA